MSNFLEIYFLSTDLINSLFYKRIKDFILGSFDDFMETRCQMSSTLDSTKLKRYLYYDFVIFRGLKYNFRDDLKFSVCKKIIQK